MAVMVSTWKTALSANEESNSAYPQIIDFETFLDTEQIEQVGLF